MAVDILILGAGWTSTFLIPLCDERSLTYASTTRDGRNSTIPFQFDPNSQDLEPYKILPDAATVLITFPIQTTGASERLVKFYAASRGKSDRLHTSIRSIQLGSTGIWDGRKTQTGATIQHKWYDRHSPIAESSLRGAAEAELLALSPEFPTTVLNLAGLWGNLRSMRKFVGKVAPTKEALKNKGSLHMIHGLDVARAILAVHAEFSKARGQRWIITDGRVYDWWDLASAWGTACVPPNDEIPGNQSNAVFTSEGVEDRGPHARWVRELMQEFGVRALPRNVEALGRAFDSRDFWSTFELSPIKARLD